MATNTTVLIVVSAVAVFLLAGMLATVVYKTRTRQRHVKVEPIHNQAEENARHVRHQEARHVRHQEALADEYAVKAHAAQVEVDIKTARACRLQREAVTHRSEATTVRNQLNEQSSRADKLNSTAHTPRTSRLAG
jgi:hypothetical protein